MNKKLLAPFGLKWNPFNEDVPIEALLETPRIKVFCQTAVQFLTQVGGFVSVTGVSGLGKSVVLRILSARFHALPEVVVGEFTRPSSNVADFYRELGDVFGVPLRPHNRWGGFKALRDRWEAHIASSLFRPVLLIDEAQDVHPAVLNELRLMSSTRLDSRQILAVVFAGDTRFPERLRQDALVPLGSRLRKRLILENYAPKELLDLLTHMLRMAGNSSLMTKELMMILCEHSMGNPRVLMNTAAELLNAAAERELPTLDEKLFLEHVSAQQPGGSKTQKQRSARK